MAEIYLARFAGTAGFEKLIVIKRIKPTVAQDRAALAMFLDEARLAATLHHSNIAEVIDVGESNDNYFFAMDYVYGRDLRSVRAAANAPLPLGVALAMTTGIASALAYAHAKTGSNGPLRIVHRDVSPSNVLVSFDGAVKLVDFGIARATSRTAKTLTGVLRGKVPYMSPEQCRGKVLDRRSDLFSLGTVLYELTTGARPFIGRTEYDMLEAIVQANPKLPSEHVRTYPRALEHVVLKMLSRDPATRYQTAEELVGELEDVTRDLGLFTSPLGVAKYMRELFAAEVAQAVQFAEVTTVPTIETPPPELFHAHDDETTSRFDEPGLPRRGSTAEWQCGVADEPGLPRRGSTAEWQCGVADEPGLSGPGRYVEPIRSKRAATETTSLDLVQFDPGIDLEAELALDDAPDEARDQRAARRIETLVDRAFACYGAGELEIAIACVELALVEEERSTSPIGSVYHHRATIMAIFEAFVGDPQQTVRLTQHRDVLAAIPEVSRTLQLVDRIDGLSSIDDLLVLSGMSPLETYRQLCALLVRRLVELR
jgi:tRNA A-37 threonylcarbamoyl transferase component Bud32